MRSFLRKLKSRDAGFTLLELLIVMIVIGILAAIAIPVFLNRRAESKLYAAKVILKENYPGATIDESSVDRSQGDTSYAAKVNFGNRTDDCTFFLREGTMECLNTKVPAIPAPTATPQPTVTVTATVTAPAT